MLELFDSTPLIRFEKNGKRYYAAEDGNDYVSVTTALSVLGKKGIEAWKKRVGEEEANKVSRQASQAGTNVHNIAEQYCLGNPFWKQADPIALSKFLELKKYLDANVGTVRGIELQMYSSELRIAGTADLVCEYNGIPSIVDFKTSRRRKSEDQILNYFIQSSAYSMMAAERYDYHPEQIVILMVLNDGGVLEFVQPIEKYKKMTQQFFRLFHENRLTN